MSRKRRDLKMIIDGYDGPPEMRKKIKAGLKKFFGAQEDESIKADLSGESVEALHTQVPDNWALCEFLGSTEAEVMVSDTIRACANNLKEHGEAFSFRGDGVFESHNGGLINNGAAYRRLLKEGLFIEAKRPASTFKKLPKGITPDEKGYVVLIYMSRTLVQKLQQFLDKQAKENS